MRAFICRLAGGTARTAITIEVMDLLSEVVTSMITLGAKP